MSSYKSSVEEIRQRFNGETEVYTNLETGQLATVDAPLTMALIAEAAAVTTPHAKDFLDVGCGGGNYTLKLLERFPELNVTLLDLSENMLARATERVRPKLLGQLNVVCSDVRAIDIGTGKFDLITASAVLHHLRTTEEWRDVFQRLYDALKPQGSLWIFDIVESELPALQAMHWRRYGEYLTSVGGDEYRERLFARILEEDTPRSVPFQLELLKSVGFRQVELLHKHSCYAAFGAIKD